MFVSNLSHHLENLTHYHLPANISGTVFGTSDYYDATLKVRVFAKSRTLSKTLNASKNKGLSHSS